MKQLEGLDLGEVKELLKGLRQYSDMSKKLGGRGKKLFSQMLTGKKSYTVEYFTALGEESAWAQAQPVFAKSFGASPKKEEVHFIAKDDIKGGMKIYEDDNMVDMSFKKVESLLQK